MLRKGKKRKREDQFIESQKGAIHKFFSVSSNVVPGDNPEEVDDCSTEDQGQEPNHNLNAEVDVNECHVPNSIIT